MKAPRADLTESSSVCKEFTVTSCNGEAERVRYLKTRLYWVSVFAS